MFQVVSGGHNGKKKDPLKDILKSWKITTDDGDTYLVKGTEIFIGDEGESLVVFDKGTVVFSDKGHKTVSLDNPEFVQKLEKVRARRKPASQTKKTKSK